MTDTKTCQKRVSPDNLQWAMRRRWDGNGGLTIRGGGVCDAVHGAETEGAVSGGDIPRDEPWRSARGDFS
jgi:hypothetical protein